MTYLTLHRSSYISQADILGRVRYMSNLLPNGSVCMCIRDIGEGLSNRHQEIRHV